jgi:hypothetical protein
MWLLSGVLKIKIQAEQERKQLTTDHGQLTAFHL